MVMREASGADTMSRVRLLIYNIRYATGTGPAFHLPVPGAGYLRSSRQVLSQITEFIKRQDPDVVGLIEVDTGSIRTGMVNQADFIARSLGHYSTFECKYGVSSVNQLVPIVRKQANAFLAAPRVRGERFHYFDTGIKRLIIELELDDVAIFLVHLSLKFRHRQYQLRYLYDLLRKTRKPVIVAGDFNTYWGDHELYLFTQAGGFIAGADIKEFLKIRTPEEGYELVRAGQTVLQTLADLPCPTVAALHGFALGGGLELALACTYRVAADDAALSLGLPEVLLGIHPGFGGTVRSVQLIGVRPALDLMLKGKPYKGARALAVGLIDELVPPADLLQRAKSRLLRSPPKATAPFVDKLLNLGLARP